MHLDTVLPFRGEVVWLTPEQGGRSSGPPPTPNDQDYAATAYVPPATIDDGLASFVLRVADRSAWRSEASGAWLAVDNEGVYWVDEGSVVVVTEGSRPVAYFHVCEVAATD
jgi:SOS-response transcriptional repressor LexA